MRLAFLANPLAGHARRWMAWFAARGHEVHLLDLRAPERGPAPPTPGVTVHEIPKGPHLPLPRGQGLLYYPAAALRARRVLRRLRPDLLHAHYISEHAWVAALSGVRPLVLTAWGGDLLAEQGAWDRPIQRLLTPLAIRRGDLLTGNSRPLLRILDRYRRPDVPVLQLVDGADRTRFRPGLPVAALRQRLGLGAAPVVLSPRAADPNYGIDTLLAAWPAVLAACPAARLVQMSYNAQPAYLAELRRQIAELDIAASVLLLDAVDHDEMPLLYNMADVVVSVPRSDGNPVSVQEALACAAAVVISDLPWAEGVIVAEHSGLVVPLGAAPALAAAIARLLGDPALRARLGQAGAAWSAAHGDKERELGRMERAYEELRDVWDRRHAAL